MSGYVTARMLWDGAQKYADESGMEGSDEHFVRLVWLAQVLAAVEQTEALQEIAVALWQAVAK